MDIKVCGYLVGGEMDISSTTGEGEDELFDDTCAGEGEDEDVLADRRAATCQPTRAFRQLSKRRRHDFLGSWTLVHHDCLMDPCTPRLFDGPLYTTTV